MKKHLPALGFALAAIACYSFGSSVGGNAFLILGAVCELAAWHSLLHPRN
jgi:hypothetical protein